ncbi:hypothetical protein [Dactylosporangium sp. CA-233914]|uniref:hypothetical protein n=1 Tax=Dactylosporangium sp. CA-233914 TaxID=3239934 RepID=UPI003D936575
MSRESRQTPLPVGRIYALERPDGQGAGLLGGQRRRVGADECADGVAASTELQERDALKSASLADAMTRALIARGVPDPTAALASELGVLAFKRGYAECG